MLITHNTHSNEDGTFSPKIVWERDGVTTNWIDHNYCLKSEDEAASLAWAHLRRIGNAVTRLLVEGHYKPEADGRVYLAVTANFWGKGGSEREALAEIKKAGGSSSLAEVGYVMYHVHPDTRCHEADGGLVYPKDQPPTKMYDKRFKRKTK